VILVRNRRASLEQLEKSGLAFVSNTSFMTFCRERGFRGTKISSWQLRKKKGKGLYAHLFGTWHHNTRKAILENRNYFQNC